MEEGALPMKRVGFWLNEKKCKKFDVEEFAEECRKQMLDVVKLDLDQPLEDQGPFDAILHKMTAMYAQALCGDMEARVQAERFESGVASLWNVPVLDPLPGVHTLLHRPATYALLEAITRHLENITTPPYVELPDTDIETKRALLARSGVSFPIVCKPVFGCGGTAAHELAVVLSERRLQEWQGPCVAQSFVPHGAVLYKLYVLGSVWHLVVRPSLKNFKATDAPTVHFNSAKVSKAGSCSTLTQLDKNDRHTVVPEPLPGVLQEIVDVVGKSLNMDLLGIDVVIDSQSGHYAIIDVNPFPSYDSVDDFLPCLARLLRHKVDSVASEPLPLAAQGYSSISDLLPPLQRSPEGELITPCVLNSAGVDVMELLYQRRLLPRKKMADSEGKDCHATESSEACNGTCHSKPVDAPATKTSPSVLVVQAEQGDSAHKQPR